MTTPLQLPNSSSVALAEYSHANRELRVFPPRAAIVEMLVLLVLPAALDYFWPAFPSLTELHPHPFWLPVLLLSLQYGTVSGLIAAGLAIALSAVIGWPDQEVGENHFSYLLRIWAQPVLWLAAALVLGQFRMRQIELKLDLALQVSELSSQRSAIADHASNLRQRCDALEREIARRRDPGARVLLSALGRLGAVAETGHGRADDARAQLAECLELAFGRCQIAIFIHDGQQLRMVARHRGLAGALPARDILALTEPLARAVLGQGRAVSILTPGEEATFAGEGLAAVPIVSGGRDSVLGMLKLEQADPAELDQDTCARLAVVASHIAPLLIAPSREWRPARLAGAAAPGPAQALPNSPLRTRLWRQVKRLPLKAGTASGSGTPPQFG